jgi:hypothetical protein
MRLGLGASLSLGSGGKKGGQKQRLGFGGGMKLGGLGGGVKKGGLGVGVGAFAAEEEKKRVLVKLDDDDDGGGGGGGAGYGPSSSGSASPPPTRESEARDAAIMASLHGLPDTAALFAVPVDWDALARRGVASRKVKPWVLEKSRDLLGEGSEVEVSLGCFFIIIGGGHRLVDRFEIRKILFIHSSWAFASASFLSLYIIDVLLVPWLSSSR